jgi:hypothetical protein
MKLAVLDLTGFGMPPLVSPTLPWGHANVQLYLLNQGLVQPAKPPSILTLK